MTIRLFFTYSARDGHSDITLHDVVSIDQDELMVRFYYRDKGFYEHPCRSILRCEVE